MRYDNLMSYDEIWWDMIKMIINYDYDNGEIYSHMVWDIISYNDLWWWNMIKYDEKLWNMMRYDEWI